MRKISLIAFYLFYSCNYIDKNEQKSAHTGTSYSLTNKINNLRIRADFYYENAKYESAIKFYDTLIQLDSLNGEYYFRRAYSFDEVNLALENEEAIADYLKAIKLGYKVADSYYNVGLCYIVIKDSVALKYFEKSLEYDSDFENSKIQILYCQKRLEEKRTRFKQNFY